ncbi:MAG: hypothetical protein K5799_09520 [Erythrobacter sp.]|nr:hypothetical protein [Erythrobacter sp.]
MIEEEHQSLRQLAVRERLIELDIDRFFSVRLDLFKWVLASTLTINGAPLVAMLASDTLRPMLLGPGVLFAVGLAFSILGNVLLVRGLAFAGQALFDAHWEGNAVSKDDYDEVAPESDVNRATLAAAVSLGLSIGAFLIGICWFGLSLENS